MLKNKGRKTATQDIPTTQVFRRIVKYPLPREYRKFASIYLKDSRMVEAYSLLHRWGKGKEVVSVFAEALSIGLLCNPKREAIPVPLSDAIILERMRDAAEMLLQKLPAIRKSVASTRYHSDLWFHAAAHHASKKDEAYPVEEISDALVFDGLYVVRDFLSSYIPKPRRRGRPIEVDQNYLMMRLEDIFRKRFGRPLNAVIALFMETVCGGGWTENEVKSSLSLLRKANR